MNMMDLKEKKLKFSYKEQKEFETIDEDIEKLEEKITDNRLQAVFLTAKNCSVCTVDKPIVEKIATKYEFPTYIAEADKSPEIIGQLNAFSAPTIILYYEGKEIHRQAKIINFQEIEKRVRQVQENS